MQTNSFVLVSPNCDDAALCTDSFIFSEKEFAVCLYPSPGRTCGCDHSWQRASFHSTSLSEAKAEGLTPPKKKQNLQLNPAYQNCKYPYVENVEVQEISANYSTSFLRSEVSMHIWAPALTAPKQRAALDIWPLSIKDNKYYNSAHKWRAGSCWGWGPFVSYKIRNCGYSAPKKKCRVSSGAGFTA